MSGVRWRSRSAIDIAPMTRQSASSPDAACCSSAPTARSPASTIANVVIYQVLRRFQPEIQPRPAAEAGADGDVERLADAPDPPPGSALTQSGQGGVRGER